MPDEKGLYHNYLDIRNNYGDYKRLSSTKVSSRFLYYCRFWAVLWIMMGFGLNGNTHSPSWTSNTLLWKLAIKLFRYTDSLFWPPRWHSGGVCDLCAGVSDSIHRPDQICVSVFGYFLCIICMCLQIKVCMY